MLIEYGIGSDARSTGYYAGMIEAAVSLGDVLGLLVR